MSVASMKLFCSSSSPFARKVLVMLQETGQADRVEQVPVVITPVSPSPALNQANPSGKLPCLVLADGTALYDSRVILEYLDHQHVGNPLIPREGAARWRRLTLAALGDAILDAAVLTRYETFLRPEDKRWDRWVESQLGKVERGLANLEAEHVAELSSVFDVAAIGVACGLGYLDFRMPDLGWRERYPQLAVWYAGVSERESMRSTQPPA